MGLIHGHLERPSVELPFRSSLTRAYLEELIRTRLAEAEADEAPSGRPSLRVASQKYRDPDARWGMAECPIPHTEAPQYAGSAREVLEAHFGLRRDPHMQDWELEVCEPDRIEEYLAFYEQQTDPAVRFDTMAIALVAYDEAREPWTWASWFDETLRRDFALHGHSVAYWAALDREANDPELARLVFRISKPLREIWESSLVPIELHDG